MANLSLVFDVLARDQASATLRRVGDEVERTGKKTEGLGNQLEGHAKRVDGFASSLRGFGSVLGGLAIVGTFKGLYDAAAESARISRLTESTIKSTGGAANITAKQIGDLATAISNKTGADDEAIQSGENLLLTFTNVRNELGAGNDIFNQATQLALDMSTALGTDMTSASLQLGKALNDPIKGITALSRAGVSFTQEQKDQIKTLVESGHTMEAQKLILAELAKEFGGAAEAASTPLDKMVTRLGNVAEEAGGHLIPVMNELIDVLGNVLSVGGNVLGFVTDLPAPLQLAAGAAVAWALAGDKITGAFGGARDKIRAFREEAELQRALFAAQARDISDTDRALGGLGTTTEMTGTRFGTARAAVAGFAKAIGPELGLALATFVISSLVDSIDRIAHAGDDATRDITAFDRSLSHIDTNSGRIDAVSSRIDDLKDKIADLVNTMPSEGEFGASAFNPVALADMIAKFKDGDESAGRFSRQLQELQEKQKNYEASTASLSAQLGISKNTVAELADKYGIDLSQGIGTVTDKFLSSQAAADIATGAVASVGNAADLTQDQIDEAAKAIEEWRNQLQQIGESFVEPLSVYKSLLDEKTQAERDQAQATADATASGKDSWKDYVGEVSVSLDEYATKLADQITAQENWRSNLVIIAQRGGVEVADILATMGVEGAGLVQQMVDSTDADFQRMRDLMIQDAYLGGSQAAANLDTQMKVMAAIGAAGGKATAQQIATQLGLGVGEVARIASEYAITLGNGVNPLLAALGHAPVRLGTGSGVGRAIGQAVGYADGGFTGSGAKYTPAGIVHAGEFVFPQESVNRLGVNFLGSLAGLPGYAGGGFVMPSDVPRPLSTAPYGPPISTAGDATMGKEYDAVTSWIKTAFAVGVGPSGGSGGAARWSGLVLQALAMMGQPSSLLGSVLRRMNQESGGNPRAINNWDINAKRGDPSRGLMQTIGSTFRAYHYPGTSWNIYDPLANVLASMRYALARYGSLSAAYNKAGGYRLGTDFVPEDGMAYLHRGEAVIPADKNQGAPYSGSGEAVFHLYDTDGVLLGSMRGHAEAAATSALTSVLNRGAYNG